MNDKIRKSKTTRIETVLKAFWSLHEGHSDMVYGTTGNYHSLLSAHNEGTLPLWKIQGGETALLFPCGKQGGVIDLYMILL